MNEISELIDGIHLTDPKAWIFMKRGMVIEKFDHQQNGLEPPTFVVKRIIPLFFFLVVHCLCKEWKCFLWFCKIRFCSNDIFNGSGSVHSTQYIQNRLQNHLKHRKRFFNISLFTSCPLCRAIVFCAFDVYALNFIAYIAYARSNSILASKLYHKLPSVWPTNK